MQQEHKLFFVVMLEQMLKEHKVSLLKDFKLERNDKYEKQLRLGNLNSKEKRLLHSEIVKMNKEYDAQIARTVKYNSEMTDGFIKANKNSDFVQQFLDDCVPFVDGFLKLLFEKTKNASKETRKRFETALLEESEDGTIFLDMRKFIIHKE